MKQTSPILKNLIAERMRSIREQREHTQEYVANNTHLKIWDYESGQKSPTLESIAKFCAFYKISLREFFDIDSFDYPLKK